MRRSLALTSMLALAALLVAPAVEAGSRRMRTRRGAERRGSFVAAASDESVQAILAATPAGGVARLPAGRYRTTIVIDRPVMLVGSPLGTWIDAAGLPGPAIRIAVGVEDVAIDSLRVASASAEGLLAEGGNHRLALRRSQFADCASDGVRIVASDEVAVDRCTFEGNRGNGLDAEGRGLVAFRLLARRNAGAGVVLRGEDGRLSDSGFQDGAEGVVFVGKDLSAFRCGFRGVGTAARFAATADTCTFERSDVRGATFGAVAEDGSVYARVAGNRIDRPSADGVVLAGMWHTVEANTINAAGLCGVRAAGSSFRIAGNTILGAGAQGVRLEGSGNMVDGNTVADAALAAVSAVGDGNVVAVNAIDRPGADGIDSLGSACRIVANRVSDAGAVGIRLSGDGNTVQDDVVTGAALEGIRLEGGSGNFLLTNRLLLCGGAGLVDLGVGTTFDRNQID